MTVVQPIYTLYPFLEGKTRNSDALDQSLLESVLQKAAESREVQKNYFERYASTGGSSCDAAHIAVEFVHPIGVGRPSLEAIDLTADTTALTAISNDFPLYNVFFILEFTFR